MTAVWNVDTMVWLQNCRNCGANSFSDVTPRE